MQFITIWDYILLPVYLFIVFFIAINFRNSRYPKGHPWRGYFLTGFILKVSGAIFIGLVYQYYYGEGDTRNYFEASKIVNSAYNDSFTRWLNLILHIPKWYEGGYTYYISQIDWYRSPAEYIIIQLTALVGVLTFNTFLPTSIIFASLAFSGVWALFRSFVSQYPENSRAIAISVLYIPSVLLWGSGIFKDTVCLGCIGWLTFGVFRILVVKDFNLKNIIFTVISFYLIGIIKVYILLAFLPALLLWILFNYLYRIKSRLSRFFIRFIVVGFAGVIFLFLSNKFSESLGRYSLDEVAKTSSATKDWIYAASLGSDGGDQSSTYDLGDFEPTLDGMIKKMPAAVNVTLFRPYPWEVRKVITLLSSLEAFLFLLITIKLLLVLGPVKVWSAITSDPNIQFCLIFTIVFAFGVGISSFNFGALSRYRIPCLPFYAMALTLIYHKYNSPEKSIFSWNK